MTMIVWGNFAPKWLQLEIYITTWIAGGLRMQKITEASEKSKLDIITEFEPVFNHFETLFNDNHFETPFNETLFTDIKQACKQGQAMTSQRRC
jgi:redox-regulated HSP33 family molecular chaperone